MVRAADLFYRALYRGLFSRLPERMAVALGQWGLRHLPLDHLTVFRRDDPRLHRLARRHHAREPAHPVVDVLRHGHPSPGYGPRIRRGHGQEHHGEPRPGHPHPNLVRIETAEGPGLVNCNGFKNPGLEAYRRALAALPHARAADRGRGG